MTLQVFASTLLARISHYGSSAAEAMQNLNGIAVSAITNLCIISGSYLDIGQSFIHDLGVRICLMASAFATTLADYAALTPAFFQNMVYHGCATATVIHHTAKIYATMILRSLLVLGDNLVLEANHMIYAIVNAPYSEWYQTAYDLAMIVATGFSLFRYAMLEFQHSFASVTDYRVAEIVRKIIYALIVSALAQAILAIVRLQLYILRLVFSVLRTIHRLIMRLFSIRTL